MGRGTSKAGSGGIGTAGSAKSISGKPFNANDYKTWTVGTKVEYNGGDDFGFSEGQVRRGLQGKWQDGTVTEVHNDHLIVNVPSVSTHLWLDDDTKEQFRVKRK